MGEIGVDYLISKEKLIQNLFSAIPESFEYCVLSDRESLSTKYQSDVDLCVPKGKANGFFYKIKEIVTRFQGYILWKKRNYGNGITLSIIFPNNFLAIRTDIYEVPLLLSAKSYPTIYKSLASEFFLKHRVRVNGVYFAGQVAQLWHLSMRKALKKERAEILNRDLSGATIIEHFDLVQKGGGKEALEILAMLKSSEAIGQEICNKVELYLTQNKLVYKLGVMKRIFNLSIRIFQKRCKVVCILGPDGVGKSTLIKNYIDVLKPAFAKIEYHHLRPYFNKKHRSPPPGEKPIKNQLKKPHGSPNYGVMKSVIKAIFLYTIYYVGYYKIKLVTQASTLVVFDRFHYDIRVDSKRFLLNLPYCLRNFLSSFLPNSDLVFILYADSNSIYERKQDLELDEITRQQEEYMKILNGISVARGIDSNKQPMDVLSQALQFTGEVLGSK